MGKIGFACKWIDTPEQVKGIRPKDECKKYQTGTTTITWLNRQTREVAEQKLWDIMVNNIQATNLLVQRVGTLDDKFRMVRIGSDMLPAYTEPNWSYFWRRHDVREYCAKMFAKVGAIARANDVRLSMHPGQFTVLASATPEIVNRSIEEFEYHADMARWMGYGQTFQDFKINVHISGRQGPEGIRSALPRLSPEARNCITIENDEMSWGFDSSLELVNDCALVLDIHHHWIKTGEYIEANDPRISMVVDSWRGVRPVIHYSVSREDYLTDHCSSTLPNLEQLLSQGRKKAHLRAHSNFYWNNAVSDWALTHSDWADIMCESKGKNLASFALGAKQDNPAIHS
jgi:UV DNA damage repair endonuclease